MVVSSLSSLQMKYEYVYCAEVNRCTVLITEDGLMLFLPEENTPLSLHFSSAPSFFVLPLRISAVSLACFLPPCVSSSGSDKCSLPMFLFLVFFSQPWSTVQRAFLALSPSTAV